MDTVSPNIFVTDLQNTIEFYKKLDFQVITTVPDESGIPIFAMMINGTVTFMFQTFKSVDGLLPLISRNAGGSLLLYIKMKDIRSYFENIKDKVPVVSGLERTFYGATEFSVIDPNNFMLTFAEDE
jgi:uncharacterized glyoxalase superfamily protein PhnB